MRKFPLLIAIILSIALSPVFAAAAPASRPERVDPKLVEKLREAALGPDVAAARDAVRQMRDLGEPARRDLLDTLRQALARDKTVIERSAAAMPDKGRLKSAEDDLAKLRAAALENISRLDKQNDTLKKAHGYAGRLAAIINDVGPVYTARAAIADALARRTDFVPMFRELAPTTDASFNQAAETRLTTLAEKALGITTAAALEIGDLRTAAPKAEGVEKTIWFYRCAQQIDAYNETLAPLMDEAELDNLHCVNNYREYLGLLPFEVDPRLLQSARRHSKEMVELNYFEHGSPTESERSPFDRMKNAGYKDGAAENIAKGPPTGQRAFDLWFDSPGHHKNMAGNGVAIGIGRWQKHWTQNMGGGPRLMLEDAAVREAVSIPGKIVPPEMPAKRLP